MIPARHNAFFVGFFNLFSRWMIWFHFRKVEIKGELKIHDVPVLMMGNHFSWWDGFIAAYINMKVFRKNLHIMMLEEQLRPRMYLRSAGAYSVRRGTRDALVTLNYTVGLLEYPENIVVIYPQGKFQSVYQHPVTFEKGIEAIVVRIKKEVGVIFYAALVDYFSGRKPALTIYLKEVPFELASSSARLESAYNDFLKACYHQQKPE